ncbi:DUF4296 domain-containing protein [uncultured Winogradskyella sp.]|uniref:DUF4296 domain-containing protein n=1 Tax=Winogradskyella sp. 4-2091 TaxID=3381659 RepID=UPI00262E7832|nr:DUF4296 domain-containing protein [uncultured Winogradskyella sp.]
MLKNLSIVLVLGLLVIACDGMDKPKKPDNLISKAQMSDLLFDIYVVNAAKGINRKTLEKNGIVPREYVLEKHNIDSSQFAESNAYYSYDTDVYKAIVEQVKERIEKEKKEYENIRSEENKKTKTRTDSLKKNAKRRKDSIKKIIDSIGFKGLSS